MMLLLFYVVIKVWLDAYFDKTIWGHFSLTELNTCLSTKSNSLKNYGLIIDNSV